MFNIGGGELIVIALIALIVLGPQRLPDAARQVGKTVGELRRISSGFQRELRDAFEEVDAPAPGSPSSTTPSTNGAVGKAVADVSSPRPARRTPLQAAPEVPPGNGAAAAVPAAKRTPRKAAAVPKADRPRSKGR
jgi:sec-independent protein translocase protein TatB